MSSAFTLWQVTKIGKPVPHPDLEDFFMSVFRSGAVFLVGVAQINDASPLRFSAEEKLFAVVDKLALLPRLTDTIQTPFPSVALLRHRYSALRPRAISDVRPQRRHKTAQTTSITPGCSKINRGDGQPTENLTRNSWWKCHFRGICLRGRARWIEFGGGGSAIALLLGMEVNNKDYAVRSPTRRPVLDRIVFPLPFLPATPPIVTVRPMATATNQYI